MNALVANKVMCAEPAPNQDERGERVDFGCCQPGTELIELGGVELEFCSIHAARRRDAD